MIDQVTKEDKEKIVEAAMEEKKNVDKAAKGEKKMGSRSRR
jgi:hypothetical protein